MSRSSVVLRSLVAVVMLAGAAQGQSAGPLQPGDRVLVADPRAGDALTVLALNADLLSLLDHRGDTVQVDVRNINALWRSLGRRPVLSGVRRGAVLGLAVGAAVGLLWPVDFASPYANAVTFEDVSLVYKTAVFGLTGAGAGAIIGALVRGERWERVPIRSLRFTVSPTGDAGLGLSFRF